VNHDALTEPPLPAAPRIYEQCSTHAMASWDSVFVVIFRTDTTAEAIRTLRRESAKLARANPKGIFLLTIVQQGAPAPAQAERNALADYLRSAAGYIRGSAVIIEGQGFRSAMVRGVATGLTMLARQPFPHQVCTLPGAGDLFSKVAEELGMEFRAARFGGAIRDLRQTVEDAVLLKSNARLTG
jgi:hypothetical protein